MSNWFTRLFSRRTPEDVETENQPYIDTTEHRADPESGRSWLPARAPKRRREQQMATLQEGFSELVGLTRSIREHMDQQVATQQTLVELMKHLPDAVEGLKSVGKATEQQTETLGLLKSQLESKTRQDQQMAESMTNFNRTLALMDKTSQSTAQTVGAMADRTKDSEEMLRNILERSERRLVWMVVMLMIGTLTVLGVGLYIGFSTREAPAPEPIMEPAQKFDQRKTIAGLGDIAPVESTEVGLAEDGLTEEPARIEETPVVEEILDEEPVPAMPEEEAMDLEEVEEVIQEEISVTTEEEVEAPDAIPDTSEEIVEPVE